MGGEAELKVASGATLKTTQATYTNGDSMDFDIPASNIKLSENSKLSIDGALRANVINDSTVINNGTIKGNLTNTGTYTGLISGVTGEFVNNGTVNTWGNLEKGLSGTTLLTKASTLSKNLTFDTLQVQDSLDLGTNTLTADIFSVAKDATLAFRVSSAEDFGKIVANNIAIHEEGTTLNLTLDTGVLAKDETKEFQVLDGTVEGSFANLSKNARYEFEDLGVTVVIVNEDFFADGTHVFTINVIEYDADITFEYDSNEDLQKITIDTLEMKEVIRPMLCEVEW